MNLEDARRQKSRQLELPWEGSGEAARYPRSGEVSTAANGNERSGNDDLMKRSSSIAICNRQSNA